MFSSLRLLQNCCFYVLIWKSFQNAEEWRFSFWNTFFRFRDIDVFLLCKLISDYVILLVKTKIPTVNTIEGVILFLLWCTFMVPSFKNTALRAAAWKTQTSPDSSKKSSSILFHKRNPYLEQFSKMKFKRFSEFHFSRNRAMSAFAQMGLAAAGTQNSQILRMLSSLAKQDKKRNWNSVLYQVNVWHLGFLKKVTLFFLRLFQKF